MDEIGCGTIVLIIVAFFIAGAVKSCAGVGSYSVDAEKVAECQRRIDQYEDENRREISKFAGKTEVEKKHLMDKQVRDFALRDIPGAVAAFERIDAEVKTQKGKVEHLWGVMQSFGFDPDADSDCTKISRELNDMITLRNDLELKIKTAYITRKKFEASYEVSEEEKNAMEQSLREVEMCESKFRQMFKQK